MRVSVALATYNGSRFLKEQLRSLASQTLCPEELVISDDGSTDNTLDIIERFATKAPFPIRLVHAGRRLGFADNFLFAASQCRYELVAFSDQDDVWCPNKLDVGHRRLVCDDSLLSLHRLVLTDSDLHPTSYLDQGISVDAVFEPLHLDPYVTGWGNSMLFRRTLLALIPGDRRPNQPGMKRLMSHDTWIYVLAAALGRVSHICQPLILYRQHGANVAGKVTETRRSRLSDILSDPTLGYREKMTVDLALAQLFADLAVRSKGGVHQRASEAAARYTLRSEFLGHRIAAYLAPTLRGRLQAYQSVLRMIHFDEVTARRRKQAAAKDLTLGVTGLVRGARRWRR